MRVEIAWTTGFYRRPHIDNLNKKYEKKEYIHCQLVEPSRDHVRGTDFNVHEQMPLDRLFKRHSVIVVIDCSGPKQSSDVCPIHAGIPLGKLETRQSSFETY